MLSYETAYCPWSCYAAYSAVALIDSIVRSFNRSSVCDFDYVTQAMMYATAVLCGKICDHVGLVDVRSCLHHRASPALCFDSRVPEVMHSAWIT